MFCALEDPSRLLRARRTFLSISKINFACTKLVSAHRSSRIVLFHAPSQYLRDWFYFFVASAKYLGSQSCGEECREQGIGNKSQNVLKIK